MSFYAEVMAPGAFARWLAAQAAPARPSGDALAARGEALFQANGCGGCHAIRGTGAAGLIGPDLTHVGSRYSLAAATLESRTETFQQWLVDPERVKPGVHMPRYGMLPPDDLHALATYLEHLE
jgi:cytochrome c oxidase subunit 2